MTHSVLLVDDDAHLLEGLRRALRHEDWAIAIAPSAEDALRMLAFGAPQVIVSDQRMAGMDGIALLERVAVIAPETTRFMLTGHASLEVALDAINRGAVARFFVKPCDPRELAAAIRQAIGERALMRAARRLLSRVREQDRLLGAIEARHPGLAALAPGASLGEYAPSEAPLDLAAEIERACAATVGLRPAPRG
jgi:DNA-binding NtrC family response regulator